MAIVSAVWGRRQRRESGKTCSNEGNEKGGDGGPLHLGSLYVIEAPLRVSAIGKGVGLRTCIDMVARKVYAAHMEQSRAIVAKQMCACMVAGVRRSKVRPPHSLHEDKTPRPWNYRSQNGTSPLIPCSHISLDRR